VAELQVAATPRANNCPRCGAVLRFADDDGTLECVCGWSERTTEPAEGLADPPAADADSAEPMLV